MKKVGLLISGMNKGGAERVVSRLTKILAEDYKIYLILFEDTFTEYEYDGELINIGIGSSNRKWDKLILLYKRTRKLKEIKKQYNLDIVISFLDSPNIVNILSKIKGCNTGVSIRNFSYYENKNSILGKLTNISIKLLYNRADFVIPVTNLIAKNYEDYYHIDVEKIKIIHNPFDIREISLSSNEQINVEHKSYFSEGKTFITVGRHMYQKGFWHLVKAFSIVKNKHNDAKLIIVGRDACEGKVEKLVNELNLRDSVLITGQEENPFKYMKNSDIYVLSSLFEGFPNSMVEAMACGCSIIATDCKSGPREILYKNSNLNTVCDGIEKADYGILVSPFDREEIWDATNINIQEKTLANAMLMCIENNELRNYYSKKARERVLDFNYEKCKNKYSEIIG